MPPLIAVINESSITSDAEVQNIISALSVQVTRDFAPIWGRSTNLQFVEKGSAPPLGSWWLVVLDNSDQAGALGYHDLTSEGLPISKVFAMTDKTYGSSLSVTMSHELLEMLADPLINLCVDVSSDSGDSFYACEICDACEDDSFSYQINGVAVSDFVYPAWFQPQAQAGSKLDQCGQISKPLVLLSGGYISILNAGSSGWQQIYGDRVAY